MEDMEMMKELNPEEMSEVSGGKCGGYSKKPATKKGCKIHRVVHGETLTNGSDFEIVKEKPLTIFFVVV